MSADRELNIGADDDRLVRPKAEFHALLQHAGAAKDVFTIKEVMFYLGQYIMQKQLYDQKQQHIVHCSQDALGRVLGVDSFSVKEPRVLFAMITKNLVAVKNQDSPPSLSEAHSDSQTDGGTEEADSERPSESLAGDEDNSEEEEEGGRKRRRSDSYSLTFDDSLSWCVIGGLESVRDRHSSQSSDSHSTSVRSEVTVADSDSDNFSSDVEDNEGVDVPDGKRAKTPLLSQSLSDAPSSAPNSQDPLSSSQPSSSSTVWTPESQPSSSSYSSMDSQELLPSSPTSPPPPPPAPELERSVSAEWRLPDSCLDPCLICQSRPKNGCIVHGRTGHLMSCYVCARKLKKRNKL
ncbi:hypothetical protein FQN60_005935, partial [Etheostoma spectabile]